jgi:hypothetical protein
VTTRPPGPPATTGWPVLERSILGTVLGLPGYAAIGIALGFTALGVFIDMNRVSDLGSIFKGCYFAGCVLAVCWVKRRALFGPLVQPPLLLTVAVPSVVLLAGRNGGSSSMTEHLLAIGAPLLNAFPTMALTTGFVLAIGLLRYALQRRPRGDDPVRRRPGGRRSSGGRRAGASSARRGGERTPAEPGPLDRRLPSERRRADRPPPAAGRRARRA